MENPALTPEPDQPEQAPGANLPDEILSAVLCSCLEELMNGGDYPSANDPQSVSHLIKDTARRTKLPVNEVRWRQSEILDWVERLKAYPGSQED